MFFPILLLFLVASADACAPMKPTERDMSKGVCEDPDDMGVCPDPTKKSKMTTTSALMTTTTTITPTSTVTASTSTTTSTTTTTTTKLPPNVCPAPKFTGQPDYTVDFNGKNFVLIADLVNMPQHYIHDQDKHIAKKTEYRNHIVFDLNEKAAGTNVMEVYCYEREEMCICEGNGNCYREHVAHTKEDYIKVQLDCVTKGNCAVDGHMVGGSKKVYKDIQYLSCNVCADNVKLSRTILHLYGVACYRTAAELQKMDTETCALGSEMSSQVCKPDMTEIVNTVAIEASISWHFFDVGERCRYRNGLDLLYFKKGAKEDERLGLFGNAEHCIVTENHKHYSTFGMWALWQYCTKGECSVYGWLWETGKFISVDDPTKIETYPSQKAKQAAGKRYHDQDAYVSKIVWIGKGPCTCNVK
ncbi:hypothetical protein QR680_011693 [Steinernema hermaphroditum]|uniref:C-type lectin domain-containing protein n=1 Tax=Steinernema hermaphroditum TaxID=289476 RepID=A0AA39I224_9BILA|nr:hypothetical protein QR680_011693 [Steinernema hermaphroditum]